MKKIRQLTYILAFSLLSFLFGCIVSAEEGVVFDGATGQTATATAPAHLPAASGQFSILLDKGTIAKGYTVSAFGDSLKLSLVPGILSSSTRVDCETLSEEMPLPWNLEKVSPVYQFEFRNKAAYDNHKPFYIQFSYSGESAGYKRVFFYDKNLQTWRPLPTIDFPKEKFVRSLIHLPYARIAVLSDPSVMAVGRASWYAYKNGNFAASPDFPKGSKLRVHNLDNGKFVDIKVNDYGPDRRLHPDRAIDLDKVAFSKIAPTGAGIINVKIEPIYVVPDARGLVLGISTSSGAALLPKLKSRAAFVLDEETGESLLEKNSSASLPIASLTKLVSMKVFFDQKIDLNKIAEYKDQDEAYNAEYTEIWRSSRLSVKDGETMTMENLVYSVLVGSANNAVETLVRSSGLDRAEFIKRMNDFAVSVGATETRFKEPTGLSADNVSSARDYAIMTKEILKNPLIQKISTTPKYEFYTINKKTFHRLYNTNNFLREGLFALVNRLSITGSKTGYLDEALHCLMTRVTGAGGEKVIVANLGAPTKTDSLEEVKDLIRYGLMKVDKNKNGQYAVSANAP